MAASPAQDVTLLPTWSVVPVVDVEALAWVIAKVMVVGLTLRIVHPPTITPLVSVPAFRYVSPPVNPATCIVMLAVNPAVIGFPAIVRTARLLVTVAEDMAAGWHTAILTLASGMPCLLTTGELLDPRLPWAPNFAGRQSVMITLRKASAALILALRALTRAGCAWSNWQPEQYLAS